METLWLDQELTYDGTQLAPHYIYRNFGILGDAIIAFIGPAQVKIEHMVDWADVLDDAPIYSPQMLHFLIEHFDTNLEIAVYRQRMLICLIKEILEQYHITLRRDGDDLYVADGKLSVSIASASTLSTLIHTGLNIETEGTPVKTAGLSLLGITDIKILAETVMEKYKAELDGIYIARCKVRSLS